MCHKPCVLVEGLPLNDSSWENGLASDARGLVLASGRASAAVESGSAISGRRAGVEELATAAGASSIGIPREEEE